MPQLAPMFEAATELEITALDRAFAQVQVSMIYALNGLKLAERAVEHFDGGQSIEEQRALVQFKEAAGYFNSVADSVTETIALLAAIARK